MKTFKSFMQLNEMAEEISLFTKVRKKITSIKTKENFISALDVFIEYQKTYGDKELGMKLQRLRDDQVDIDDVKFAVNIARKQLASLYNWYNNKKRKAPKDIKESAVIV